MEAVSFSPLTYDELRAWLSENGTFHFTPSGDAEAEMWIADTPAIPDLIQRALAFYDCVWAGYLPWPENHGKKSSKLHPAARESEIT